MFIIRLQIQIKCALFYHTLFLHKCAIIVCFLFFLLLVSPTLPNWQHGLGQCFSFIADVLSHVGLGFEQMEVK